MHYFDYNATAPIEPAAREVWLEVVDTLWGNPSGLSRFSARAHHRLTACRQTWAQAFGVEPSRVVFLGGATDANNAVFAHLAEQANSDARVLLSAIEHPSVHAAATRYFRDRTERIPVDRSGRIEVDWLEQRLQVGTIAFVAVMAANNETGVLQPVDQVSALCAHYMVKFFCDAAQWVGKCPISALPAADYISFSGHKFGGPHGIGGLILGPTEQAFRGRVGGGQENGHQAGTEDLAGIAGMTAALEAQPPEGWSPAGRDAFVGTLAGPEFSILGATVDRLPNTVSLFLPRHPATRWISRLDRHGWIVSKGSACSSGKAAGSHVLGAMGLSRSDSDRVLRISGGPTTSVDDWCALRDAIDEVLRDLDAEPESDKLTTVIDPA